MPEHRGPYVLVALKSHPARRFIAEQLAADDFRVRTTDCRGGCIVACDEEHFDAVLCDVDCAPPPETPAVVLQLLADGQQRRGAVTATHPIPFAYPQLRRALQRLIDTIADARELHSGELRIDTVQRTVTVGQTTAELTRSEYRLLCALVLADGQTLTKAQLNLELFDQLPVHGDRRLDSHAVRLRHKLRDAGASAAALVCVWGVGYRLSPVQLADSADRQAA